MAISLNLENEVQSRYEKECIAHLDGVSTILELLSLKGLSEELTLVGLSDAFSSIIAKQAELDNVTDEDMRFRYKLLELIDSREDKIRSFALINKLCTEMLCKSMIAREVAKEMMEKSREVAKDILKEVENN